VISALQCSGNRGGEGLQERTVDNEFSWGIGSGLMGNAVWGGVSLLSALKHYGLLMENGCVSGSDDCGHVVLEGADGYVTSVPLAALHDDCLLVTSMNGQARGSFL
jgi:DMSO/TMAO reductase YedYZ molybdopterin-dependent catalytic subunit